LISSTPRSVSMVPLAGGSYVIRSVFEDAHTELYTARIVLWGPGEIREFEASGFDSRAAILEASQKLARALNGCEAASGGSEAAPDEEVNEIMEEVA
jgi:hypothetical protein